MKQLIPDLVSNALSTGRIIRIPVRTLGSKPKLRRILEEILSNFGCREIINPLFTCIMELLNNALKANYKNIYFENYHHLENRHIDYPTALKLFKLEISREERILQNKAVEMHMNAEILLRMLGDMFHFSVSNPVQMTADEYLNIMTKIEVAQNCSNLTDYFLKNQDDPFQEGAGLGIVLILIILKSLGGGRENLSIRSENNCTVASIILPLNNSTLQAYRKNTAEMHLLTRHSV
jgi:hypothetical protein